MSTSLLALGPVLSLYMLPQSEFSCVSILLFLKDLVSLVFFIPTDSYNLSTFPSAVFPKHQGERADREIPFRTECFTVSYSPHIVQLSTTTSLMMTEKDTDL